MSLSCVIASDLVELSGGSYAIGVREGCLVILTTDFELVREERGSASPKLYRGVLERAEGEFSA